MLYIATSPTDGVFRLAFTPGDVVKNQSYEWPVFSRIKQTLSLKFLPVFARCV